ncbi:hypothetical protein PVK06_000125 [Gossypium arboreum]|uniref:Uncharacterized protein n=1 Tax=Gossypium arboreum TaxID=29729 RepID=A0ABR0QXD2_GOSAR|nr:hypothetical protein PVK06_000125 [Gossypium arboreum]
MKGTKVIDENVKRDKVEKLVRELIEGEKGVEMKTKAIEWKKKAKKAASPDGYFVNLDKLLTQVLCTPSV